MFSPPLRTPAEEDFLEARLDKYNQKSKSKTDDSERDEAEKKPRQPRLSEAQQARAGRWVAPIILGLTVILSTIFWGWQTLIH